jgi:hypothetical protein
MLKNIEISGKKSQATLNMIDSFLSLPIPRKLPDDIIKQSQSIFFKIGFILTTVMSILMLIFFPLIIIFLPWQLVFSGAVLPLFWVTGIVFLIIGKKNQKQQLDIFSKGNIYEGIIIKINILPGTVNNFNFFQLHLEFENEQGGKNVCYETVRSDIIDNFIKIMDEETPIDILWYDKIPQKAILPQKLIYMSRYN